MWATGVALRDAAREVDAMPTAPLPAAGDAVAAGLAVAFSGGRDSTALLHAVWRALTQLGDHSIPLHALHVHHGLQAAADDWAAHCRRQVRRWSARGARIHFHLRELKLQPAPGESLEAAAREARYAALTGMAVEAGCTHVLLAHHADDQAETFLLQALRGAGSAGLASMPRQIERRGIVWLRPWLDLPRRAIEAYVQRHRLSHIEDGSNADPRYARNRLRHHVLPALENAFPGAVAVLGRAARQAQEARVCLEALARIDLAAAGRDEGALQVAALRALGSQRLRNALRLWLQEAVGAAPAREWIERLSQELVVQGGRRWRLSEQLTAECHRGVLRVSSTGPCGVGAAVAAVTFGGALLQVPGPGRHRLPDWGGVLEVERADSGGVSWACLERVELRHRQGGETFQRALNRPARSLKKQFQSAGLPAWAREGPLLYDLQGRLLFVPGLGVDARCLAPIGEDQARLVWHPGTVEPAPLA